METLENEFKKIFQRQLSDFSFFQNVSRTRQEVQNKLHIQRKHFAVKQLFINS